jgi:hypothetical protein
VKQLRVSKVPCQQSGFDGGFSNIVGLHCIADGRSPSYSKQCSFSAKLPPKACGGVTLNTAEAHFRLRFGETKLKTRDCEDRERHGAVLGKSLVI